MGRHIQGVGTHCYSEPMAATHHSINYVELTVTDLAAAQAFYRDAFGWEFNDYGPTYAGIRAADGTEAGGLWESPEARPVGGPFVILFSTDLDASLRAIQQAGGRIVEEPYEFPGGRRLHFADPSGNELGVWAEQ